MKPPDSGAAAEQGEEGEAQCRLGTLLGCHGKNESAESDLCWNGSNVQVLVPLVKVIGGSAVSDHVQSLLRTLKSWWCSGIWL